MFRKMLLSPFFAPVVFVALFGLSVCSVYFGCHDYILQITEDGQWIDVTAKIGYILLIAVLFYFCNDFRDKMTSWGIYLFFSLACFLRESGIQHHLSATDSTPFKSRFFLNPNNPLGEKIIFGAVLILIFGALAYIVVKYTKSLVLSFFKFNPLTWTIAVLCTDGVVGKLIDRYPANYRKAHGGMSLPDDVYSVFQLVEETSEMFLPYLAMLAIFQYHQLRKISK